MVADSGGRYPTIRSFTAPPAYLRFHGPAGLYASPYGEAQLAEYIAWVRAGVPEDATVYAFFNNDVGGHAVTNARQLRALAGAAGGSSCGLSGSLNPRLRLDAGRNPDGGALVQSCGMVSPQSPPDKEES